MSHYAVLVFGENVEDLLEPYDENIEVDEYFDGVVSEEEKDTFIEYYEEVLAKKETPLPEGLSKEEKLKILYEQFGEDWNGNVWKLVNGEWGQYSTYNPNSKWDWYSIGGRFEDSFQLKPEAYLKGHFTVSDFDFDGEIEIVRKKATEHWEGVNKAFNGIDTSNFKSWNTILSMENLTFEEKKDLYNKQPEVSIFENYLKSVDRSYCFEAVEEYLVSKEEFVNNRVYESIAPYVYLSEQTGWAARGEIGWFGMSRDNFDAKEWHESFMQFVKSLPPDTPVTVVDCHI